MNLSEALSQVSTAALLGEIARRCQHTPLPAVVPLKLPSWARPALQLVALETGLTLPEILDNTIHTNIAAGNRHLAMWLLRLTTGRSYAEIAALWGQDHGTVIYALRKIRNLRLIDPEFSAFADTLPGKLNPTKP